MDNGREDAVLLDLVAEIFGILDLKELRPALLAALQRAVPADFVSLNEIGPDEIISIVEPPLEERFHDSFARYAGQNPLYQRWERTRDGRAYRFSDVTNGAALRSTDLYRELYGPLGIEHQMAFTLPDDGPRMLAIALSRCERDFSDGERALVDRARPYLIQAFRNAVAFSELGRGPNTELKQALVEHGGLTERQAEIVRLVALGSSNRDVADVLGLSDRTVQKHLENAYRVLGVKSRSAAAAAAWDYARR